MPEPAGGWRRFWPCTGAALVTPEHASSAVVVGQGSALLDIDCMCPRAVHLQRAALQAFCPKCGDYLYDIAADATGRAAHVAACGRAAATGGGGGGAAAVGGVTEGLECICLSDGDDEDAGDGQTGDAGVYPAHWSPEQGGSRCTVGCMPTAWMRVPCGDVVRP